MNKYLNKIAETYSSGSMSTTSMSSSGGKLSTPKTGGIPGGPGKPVKITRMGPHTTPDDLLPNPQKMDIETD